MIFLVDFPCMGLKIDLSTANTGLRAFVPEGEKYRKDFIRPGKWVVQTPEGKQIFEVDAARIQKWEATFKLMQERGVTVPLTVDHIEIRDVKTGELLLKKLTPGMAEAKRGNVVGLFAQNNLGFVDVMPADKDAKLLMDRCPEVSLEMTEDFIDGHGNHYDEGITAITLTPKPVIPAQQQKWMKIAASRTDAKSVTVRLSAEPYIEEIPSTETLMTPEQIAAARKILKLGAEVTDEQVKAQVASGLLAHVQEQSDRIVQLSRDLETANAGRTVVRLSMVDIEKEIDTDALDMAADATTTEIDSLLAVGKITPVQKTMLLSLAVGTATKRNVVMLSRKAATQIGLPGPLAKDILAVFKAGDPVEMLKLLTEVSKGQNKKTELSRTTATGTEEEYDPKVTEAMIARANTGNTTKAGFNL